MKTIVGLCALMFIMGCGMYNRSVRDSYKDKKISYPSTVNNMEKVSKSSFKNFMILKISRECDFDLAHFKSYSYHYRDRYTTTDIDIYSSLIEARSLYTSLANVLDDSFKKASDGSFVIRSYKLSKSETFLTKDYTCEIRVKKPDLVPGDYDANSAELTIVDEHGTPLFDSKIPGTKFRFTIKEVKDRLLYGEINGECKIDGEIFAINTGKVWVKM
jgi:hypothetical protein